MRTCVSLVSLTPTETEEATCSPGTRTADARNEPVRTASEPVLFAAEPPLQVLHWLCLFVWFGFYFLLLFYYYLLGQSQIPEQGHLWESTRTSVATYWWFWDMWTDSSHRAKGTLCNTHFILNQQNKTWPHEMQVCSHRPQASANTSSRHFLRVL